MLSVHYNQEQDVFVIKGPNEESLTDLRLKMLSESKDTNQPKPIINRWDSSSLSIDSTTGVRYWKCIIEWMASLYKDKVVTKDEVLASVSKDASDKINAEHKKKKDFVAGVRNTKLFTTDFDKNLLHQKLIDIGVNFQNLDVLDDEQIRMIKDHVDNNAIFNCSSAGVGKTLVGLCAYLVMTNFSIPLIIFGSKPAILSWIRQELPKWLSDKLKQYIFLIDSSVSASDVVNRLKTAKIVLINYEAVGKFREEIEVWCRKHVPFGILDEGHRLKNYNSKKTQVMMWLRDKLRHLLILTATPNPNDKMGEIQNDLITMINLAIPFTSRNAYSDEIVAKDAFRNMMTRSSALPEEIVKGPIYVDMHPIHRKIYLEYIASPQMVAKISNYVRQNDWFNAHVCLTHILIYNACPSSPLLIQALKNNSDIPKQVINYLENNGPGAKIEWTINQVKELVEKKKKVIVWSAWNDVLHTIKVILEDCGIKSVIYNGEVDKDLALENFKKPENMVLLGNIGCGEAVSFHQEAQHAIFNDHNYNACHFMQAKNRHRRKGMPSGTIATTYYVYSQIDSNEEYSIDYSVRNNIISKTDNLDDIFGQEEIDSNEDQENDTNKLVGADEERRKQKYEDIIDNISKPFLDRGIDIPKQTDDLIFNKTKNEPKQPRDVGT